MIDIRLAVTKSPFENVPVMMKCRHHKDDKKSMAVYPDGIFCFGCSFRIQQPLPALAYLLGTNYDEAKARAGEFESGSVQVDEMPLEPMPDTLPQVYHQFLYGHRQDRLRWLHERWLTNETIRQFAIGHDGTRYTIPVYNGKGELVTIRFRQDPLSQIEGDDKPKYSGIRGRNKPALYPEWLVATDDRDYLVVVEGELDAVRLWQRGLPAVTQTNGAGRLPRLLDLLKPYSGRVKWLYIMTDQDQAGEHAAQELLALAPDYGYRATRINWPIELGKDVTELLKGEENDAYLDTIYTR